MLLLQQLIGLLLIFLAYGDDCPIFFNPPEVVVEYEGQFSVNCTTHMTDDFGLSWKGDNETVNSKLIPKNVDTVMDWDMQLTCHIDSNETQCSQNLSVIIYKTPDSVSIITVNHNGPMMEGNQYELQCDVLQVAPAQFLTVKWYKGPTLVNQTSFTDTIKTPVNKTAKLMIRPNRADDEAQYSCEAELKLGEEGPQPPPRVTSDPLNITVYYTECPLQFNPQRVVVEYGGSVSVNCSTSVQHDDMRWEISEGETTREDNPVTWSVSELREWGIKPSCFINHVEQCELFLPLTIYKTPDSVSIITVNHSRPMMERSQYELQCDVLNVAPAQFLTVKWYKGPDLVDQTNFTDTIKTPVNKTVKLMIRPNRADDGAQYKCEAELKLGEEGPQPPPKVTSKPLNITVHYKPIINETKLPSVVPVFRGYPVELVCEAEGNPKPTITWNIGTNNPDNPETLTITDSSPEDLYCIANNSIGITTRHVKVSIQEDNIILIIVIVVAVMVAILLLSIFIYCTFYKNARTGQYNFMKPKAPKGLLAQPAQVPMKEQNNISALGRTASV